MLQIVFASRLAHSRGHAHVRTPPSSAVFRVYAVLIARVLTRPRAHCARPHSRPNVGVYSHCRTGPSDLPSSHDTPQQELPLAIVQFAEEVAPAHPSSPPLSAASPPHPPALQLHITPQLPPTGLLPVRVWRCERVARPLTHHSLRVEKLTFPSLPTRRAPTCSIAGPICSSETAAPQPRQAALMPAVRPRRKGRTRSCSLPCAPL